jgi:antitoxin VapB
MVLHVRDAETDALVRELALRRGISLTEAIKEAVQLALSHEAERVSLWDSTADLRATIASYPVTGLSADKAFFDELSGQGE